MDDKLTNHFIFHTWFYRLKKHLFKSDSLANNTQVINTNDPITYFTIPYVPSISERFKHIVKDLDVRLSYYSINKMKSFIRVHKDSLPSSNSINVIYKLNCIDCDASYVGQTSRQLHTRINEHRSHIRRNTILNLSSLITKLF